MSEFKSLEEITGYLCNVAEYELNKHDIIPIHGGHLTVVSKNYEDMYRAIEWIEDKIKQPTLNENQKIVLEKLKRVSADYGVYDANPFENICCFVDDYGTEEYYENLTAKQEAEVLQAFIQWALEQEEE